jgi:WD40 repeat protein
MRHDDDVVSAEFSADGRVVVTASADRSARIWDASTGRPITPPLWHRSSVAHAVFSPEGHQVATLTADGEARLWDAATGEPITPTWRHPHRYDAGHLMFSADGQRLLLATGADAVFLRAFRQNTAALDDLVLQAQVLSGHRIDPTAGMLALDRASLSNAWQRWHSKPPAP